MCSAVDGVEGADRWVWNDIRKYDSDLRGPSNWSVVKVPSKQKQKNKAIIEPLPQFAQTVGKSELDKD